MISLNNAIDVLNQVFEIILESAEPQNVIPQLTTLKEKVQEKLDLYYPLSLRFEKEYSELKNIKMDIEWIININDVLEKEDNYYEINKPEEYIDYFHSTTLNSFKG